MTRYATLGVAVCSAVSAPSGGRRRRRDRQREEPREREPIPARDGRHDRDYRRMSRKTAPARFRSAAFRAMRRTRGLESRKRFAVLLWGQHGVLAPGPIEIPLDAGRVAESPQEDAGARDAGVVVADRAAHERERATPKRARTCFISELQHERRGRAPGRCCSRRCSGRRHSRCRPEACRRSRSPPRNRSARPS